MGHRNCRQPKVGRIGDILKGFMTSMQLRRTTAALLYATVVTGAAAATSAEDNVIGCNQDAMLVFDASGSMASMGYNGLKVPRIFEARDALRTTLPEVTPFRRLGLVVYGPGSREACSNVDLRFNPFFNAADRILAEVDSIQPEGETPLTLAVETAVQALQIDKRPGTIVLVTDGRETCGGSPCALADQFIRSSADLTVHVIGFKVRGETFDPTSFGDGGFEKGGHTVASCLSDRTGGLYVSAESMEELIDALRQTLGCALLSETEGSRQFVQNPANRF